MLTARTVLSAAALLGLAPVVAAAPQVDELIDKAVAAMGGKAIQKIESYRAASEMTAPMGTMTSEVYWAKPSHVLVKRAMPGMGEIEMGTDGKVGWMKSPMAPDWQLMDGADLDQITQQAMHMRVFRLRETLTEDYGNLESAGATEFAGANCYEMRMKDKEDQQDAAMYFDAESGLIRGIKVSQAAADGPRTMTITFGDWKPVGEVKFFRSMEMNGTQMGVTVHYTEIEVNKVDPALFEVPEAVVERLKQRASRPEGAPMELEDFSIQVQNMINGTMQRLPWDDAEELTRIRAAYEKQIDRAPGEFKDGMKYIVRKIDERLKELASDG